MRLTSLTRALRREDEGAALASVMGLMLLMLVVTVLITSSVVNAYSYSTFTRAGVESRSAAEAGISAARAGLIAGTCNSSFDPDTHPSAGVYTSAPGEVPEYRAEIYPRAGAGWAASPGCPSSASVDVRILTTGAAEARGVAGASGRDEATLEAVLATPAQPTTIVANGPAVFGYNGGSLGAGGRLLTADGLPIDVIFRNGNIVCNGGMAAVTNLVVANGDLTVEGGCGVSGTAWVSGTLKGSGGANVAGDMRANRVEISNGTYNGDIHALNDFIATGWATYNGNITARKITIAGGVFKAGLWSYTDLKAENGTYTTTKVVSRTAVDKPSWLNIPNIQPPTYPAVPGVSPWEITAAPVVPQWIDYTYDSSLWAGFVEYDMGSDCSRANFQAAIAHFAGRPGLVNALGCSSFAWSSGEDQFVFTNDVAIFANKFDLNGGGAFTAGGAGEHRVWLLNPDDTPDLVPTCAPGEQLKIDGGFKFKNTANASLHVMVYSPCTVTIGSSTAFSGQLFVNSSTFAGAGTVTYSPVGLPGYDLSTGLPQTSIVTEHDRRLSYVRPYAP